MEYGTHTELYLDLDVVYVLFYIDTVMYIDQGCCGWQGRDQGCCGWQGRWRERRHGHPCAAQDICCAEAQARAATYAARRSVLEQMQDEE